MVINAVWLEHPPTEFLNQNMEAIVGSMVTCGIKHVFVQVGNWHADGTTSVSINQWWTDNQISATINAIHSYSGNTIQVHAWMIWSGPSVDGGDYVDLTDATTRANAVNLAISYCESHGFDGFNDDLIEGYTGTDGDYVTFANMLGRGLGSHGYHRSCDLPAMYVTDIAGIYGSITEMNYVCPMFYDSQPWNSTDTLALLAEVLSYSSCSVLAGLCASPGTTGFTLGSILSWVGVQTHNKFAGVCPWSLIWLGSYSSWQALASWYSLYGTATMNMYFEAYYPAISRVILPVIGTLVSSTGGTYTVTSQHSISLVAGTYVFSVAGTVMT